MKLERLSAGLSGLTALSVGLPQRDFEDTLPEIDAQTIEVWKMLYGLLDRVNARKAEKSNRQDDKPRQQGKSLS